MPKKEDSTQEREQLSGLTVLEVADLVKQLETKWGVSAAAPVAVAWTVAAAAEAGTRDFEERLLADARRRFLVMLSVRLETLNDADLIGVIHEQLQHITANLDEAFKRAQAMNNTLSHA